MKVIAIASIAAAVAAATLLISPSLASPSAPSGAAPEMMSPEAPDEAWGCIYTGPLNKKLCVEVTKTFCFNSAMFLSGRWYEGETCDDLEARGAY
jgi:hypothetical protein